MTVKRRILCQPHLQHVGKLFMCISRLHNFCIDQGYGLTNNADDKQGNESGLIPSDINETSIAANSVLRDIIVQELAHQSLERPSFK